MEPPPPAPPGASTERADAEALQVWRADLDRLNREIVERVQARARIVRAIARYKRQRGLPAVDVERERAMLDEMLRAPSEGFSAAELARLLRVAMRFYRRLAMEPDR